VEATASALFLLEPVVEAPVVAVVAVVAVVEVPVVEEVPAFVCYHTNHHPPSYSWWRSSDSTTTASFSVVLSCIGRSVHYKGNDGSCDCIKAPVGDCGKPFRTSCHGEIWIYTLVLSKRFCDGIYSEARRGGKTPQR
jgi:hypothetical protein